MHRSIVIMFNSRNKLFIIWKKNLCCCRESLFSGLEWITGLLHWNGLLEHWNGLEHACHKFEFSMSTVHMHAGSLYSVDWNGPLDCWNGLLDYWTGLLEHACHKFEVSMTIVHMHACMHTAKKERLFQQWISCWSCIIIILCCTVFVREQCSADCDTLHG